MLWNKTYGGTSGDRAWAVKQTSDGGYVIAGQTESFGAGILDFYVVRTDASGDMLWNKTYGGTDREVAYSVLQTSDGFLLAGYTLSFGAGGGDVWVVKTDFNGNTLWNQTYGGIYGDGANSLIQTSDGFFMIAGYTLSPASWTDFLLLRVQINLPTPTPTATQPTAAPATNPIPTPTPSLDPTPTANLGNNPTTNPTTPPAKKQTVTPTVYPTANSPVAVPEFSVLAILPLLIVITLVVSMLLLRETKKSSCDGRKELNRDF